MRNCPWFGPMKVDTHDLETDNYRLELPQQLKSRRIDPTFHVNLLRRHEPNDDGLFPKRDAQAFYDMDSPDDAEWLVDEIIAHGWMGNKVKFFVKWNLGDSTSHTRTVRIWRVLDDHLELHGAQSVQRLPKGSQGMHNVREMTAW